MRSIQPFVLAAAVCAMSQPAFAQGQAVEIRAEVVSGNVYVLYGQGGNIGLSVGPDGPIMVDDQFAPLTPRILEAVEGITDKAVKFVINTHWHGDHTGGNENMADEGAIIVAHENVRRRMSSEQVMEAFGRTVPASPEGALPVITFPQRMTLHWNGDDIIIHHVPHAHTDGDSILYFRKANVFHMGDVYFNGMYPFIDPGSGGVIDGVIHAVNLVLEHANEESKFIPGHGEVSGRDELVEYRDMLMTVRDRIKAMLDDGKSKEEVVASKPTADLDETWGGGFFPPDQFVGVVYEGMTAAAARADGSG